MLTRILLALLTVLVFGAALTGNAFGAFYPIVFFERLHLILWLVGYGVGAFVGWMVWKRFQRLKATLLFPVYVTSAAIVGAVVGMAIVAEVWRYKIVAEFAPDHLSSQSFFTSLRSAPAEAQFTLHSVMLKQCESFGWSYREMSPYPIPQSVVANTVPFAWIADGTRCGQVP